MKARISILMVLIATAVILGFIILETTEPSMEPPIIVEENETDSRLKLTEQELTAINADYEKGLLVLINKEQPVTVDYVPADLTHIVHFAKDRTSEGRFMRSEAAVAFDTMCEAAMTAGYEIVSTTAYRSFEFQASLYSYYVNLEGQEWADANIAKPGTSEHQTGLAADCTSSSVDYELVAEFGETAEGIWLQDHAQNYGFIIRYPKDRQDITGYTYEPWHIRYVGATTAMIIYNNNLTLEEFLEDRFRDY